MLAGPEEDGSQRRSDPLPDPVDENLGPGQGNDVERGLALGGDRGRRDGFGFLRPGPGLGRVRFRRPDGGAGSPASLLAGSTLGASPGVATRYTVFGAPSVFRWPRAITPVPTISVNASGAATNNLLLTARAPGRLRRLSFGSLGRRRLGRRRVCFGA